MQSFIGCKLGRMSERRVCLSKSDFGMRIAGMQKGSEQQSMLVTLEGAGETANLFSSLGKIIAGNKYSPAIAWNRTCLSRYQSSEAPIIEFIFR
jgi:hypothetical protein